MTVFDANKAVLDKKTDDHKAAVATYREDTLKKADAVSAQTTHNNEKAMDQMPATATATESLVKAGEALDIVKAEQVNVKELANKANVKFEIPEPAKDTSDIKFKHARDNGKGFAVGPPWLNR